MQYQARTCFSSAVGEGETAHQAIAEMLKVMVRPRYPVSGMLFKVQLLEGNGPLTSLESTLVDVEVSIVKVNGVLTMQWHQI